MIKKFVLACALGLTVASFGAHALGVRPLASTFPVTHKAGVMTVTNTNDTPKTYQVFAYEWTAVDGKQKLTLTKNVRFAPSLMTIAPKGVQTVRYVHAGQATTEQAYRIVVKEIPDEVTPTKSGIINAFTYDFPWIWRPDGAKPKLSARWEGSDLLIKNSGNATARLTSLTAGATIKSGLLGYVLPGEERRLKLEAKQTAAKVSLTVNGETLDLDAK